MSQLWQDPRRHPLATGAFSTLWLARDRGDGVVMTDLAGDVRSTEGNAQDFE